MSRKLDKSVRLKRQEKKILKKAEKLEQIKVVYKKLQ